MNKRLSGVLLHITSLPGTAGIGTLGKEAYKFVDWLREAHQSLWQILPLGPTGYGDSPYASFSTFAGNPLLIDLDSLVEKGWAKAEDIIPADYIKYEGRIDYGSVVWWKMPVLRKCAEYFASCAEEKDRALYEAFCKKEKGWLNNFASYMSIKEFYDAKAQEEKVEGSASVWNKFWPKDLAACRKSAVTKWNKEHEQNVEQYKIIQFFFAVQWGELKSYANKNGIKIIGDIPIYVSLDSADTWANQNLFQMNEKTLEQKVCAGVPPDYFCATGQLWGNPLYDWKAMKEDGYAWWVERIKHMLSLVDIVRIDHFRGFESYWAVPYGAENAIGGKWCKGPGKELFNVIKENLGELPIIAEDLGIITEKVTELRKKCGFPGMKILQFAFGGTEYDAESSRNAYLPHNFTDPLSVIYTGTHDNDTMMGLLESEGALFKKNVTDYLGLYENVDNVTVTHALIREAFKSTAEICIVPLQDVYNIGSEGRMNTPAVASGNWQWRMSDGLLDKRGCEELCWYSKMYLRNEQYLEDESVTDDACAE